MKAPEHIRAFTVVELLVATAITAVLAALLITITSGVMGVWNRSRGALTTSNQVKLALDQLATDLEGAIVRSDGNVWFAASILETNNPAVTTTTAELRDDRNWIVSGTGSTRIKPESDPASPRFDARNLVLNAPSIEDCAFGRAGVWLRFFTVRAGSNDGVDNLSVPVAVAYQICRRRVGAGSDDQLAYMLYRSAVRGSGSGTGQDGGVVQIGYNLDPGAGNAYSTPSGRDGDPGNVVRPNANQVLAMNVVDFGVRLYVREGGFLRLVFPAQPSASEADPRVGTPSSPASTAARPAELAHFYSSDPVAFVAADAYRHVKPDIVDVMVRVLTDEGVARLQAYEAGVIAGDWWDIVLAHSRVYTRRIEIRGEPL